MRRTRGIEGCCDIRAIRGQSINVTFTFVNYNLKVIKSLFSIFLLFTGHASFPLHRLRQCRKLLLFIMQVDINIFFFLLVFLTISCFNNTIRKCPFKELNERRPHVPFGRETNSQFGPEGRWGGCWGSQENPDDPQ